MIASTSFNESTGASALRIHRMQREVTVSAPEAAPSTTPIDPNTDLLTLELDDSADDDELQFNDVPEATRTMEIDITDVEIVRRSPVTGPHEIPPDPDPSITTDRTPKSSFAARRCRSSLKFHKMPSEKSSNASRTSQRPKSAAKRSSAPAIVPMRYVLVEGQASLDDEKLREPFVFTEGGVFGVTPLLMATHPTATMSWL
ncbi:MAG: hypothetical protein R3A47_10260 [Polyangiales bacterium]